MTSAPASKMSALACLVALAASCTAPAPRPAPATPAVAPGPVAAPAEVPSGGRVAPKPEAPIELDAAKEAHTPEEPQGARPAGPDTGARDFGALWVPAGALDHLSKRVGQRREGAPLVVVQYGDSHSRAGVMPRALRDKLGEAAEPGYTQVGHPPRGEVVTKRSGRWTRHNWLYRGDAAPFGPMGVAFSTADPDARMSLKLRSGPALPGTRATIFFSGAQTPPPFEIRGGEAVLLEFTGEGFEHSPLAMRGFEIPPGLEEVTLHMSCRPCQQEARLRVFGFLVQVTGADISWDNFGVGGTTIFSPHKRADEAVEAYLGHRSPDLLVLWYGANSSPDPSLNVSAYKRRYAQLVRRFRAAAPEASCLLVGPPDMALFKERTCFMNKRERRLARKKNKTSADRKRLRKRRRARACNPKSLVRRSASGAVDYPGPRIHSKRRWRSYLETCKPATPTTLPRIVAAQREVAEELGCAYFDIYADMGGAGTALDWACQEEPALISADLIHMTRAGYEKVAAAIHASLSEAIASRAAQR